MHNTSTLGSRPPACCDATCCCVVAPAALPWQSAAAKSTAADDGCFKYFRLSINQQAGEEQRGLVLEQAAKLCSSSARPGSAGSSAPQDNGVLASLGEPVPELCQCLCLDASLPWPLGVLITPKHLADYNRLFRLLLQVKRVQLDLEAAWQELGRWAE